MASAKVLIAEIDRSSYVPETSGVYGFMVLPAVRGSITEAGFATSEADFLRQSTPDGRVEVDMDLAYYVAIDFLRRSNKLWWARAHNGASIGGLLLPADGTSGLPTPLAGGFESPDTVALRPTDVVLLYATSPGGWGNDLGVKIEPNVVEDNAFNILVYQGAELVETWAASRNPSARDGNGQSLYVETVLGRSAYIRGIDNTSIDAAVLPKNLSTITTQWDAVEVVTAYAEAVDALAKKVRYTWTGTNEMTSGQPVNIAGAPFVIPAAANAVTAAGLGGSQDHTANVDVARGSSDQNWSFLEYSLSASAAYAPAKLFPTDGFVSAATPAQTAAPAVVAAGASIEFQVTANTYRTGDVSTITVAGRPYSITHVAGETRDEVLQRFVTAVNADPNRLVNASFTSPYIEVTSIATGTAQNSITIVDVTNGSGMSWNAQSQPAVAVDAVASAGILETGVAAGVTTGGGTTIFSVGSSNYTVVAGTGDTSENLAITLAALINADPSAVVVASVAANQVAITSKLSGIVGDSYVLGTSGGFPGLASTVTAMAGGVDATTATFRRTLVNIAFAASAFSLDLGTETVSIVTTGSSVGITRNEIIAGINASVGFTAAANATDTLIITTSVTGDLTNGTPWNVVTPMNGREFVTVGSAEFTGGLDAAAAVVAQAYAPAVTTDMVVVRDFAVATAYDADTSTAQIVDIRVDGNSTGAEQIILFDGVEVRIADGSDNDAAGAAILTQLAAILVARPDYSSVTYDATSKLISIAYLLSAGAAPAPVVNTQGGIKISNVVNSQQYQAAVSGQPEIVELHVTGSATSNGVLQVAGYSVSVATTDSLPAIASKIASTLHATSTFEATAESEKVVVTYAANGPQVDLAYSTSGTGAGLATVTTQTGTVDVPAIHRRDRVTVSAGNPYLVDLYLQLAGVGVNINAYDSTPTLVASRIAAADLSNMTGVVGITASGSQFEIEWDGVAGDREGFDLNAGVIGFTQDVESIEVQAAVPAAAAVSEVQRLEFVAGNSSGLSEVLYIGGVAVNITDVDLTPTQLAARVIATDVASEIPSMASAIVDPIDDAAILFYFETSAGDVDLVSVHDTSLSPVWFGGGSNGDAVTDTHMVAALDLQKSLTYNILLDSGWATAGYQKELASLAETRQDCIAILTVPYEVEASSNAVVDIVDYRKNVLNLNTSYAALYAGHLKIVDKFNDRSIWIPPSGAIGALASTTMENLEWWIPVAGDQRGQLSWPTDVSSHFSEGEMDLLYDNQINPIWFDPGRGIKVWGQKTLHARPSALDRVNVRLLMIYIEVAMKEYLNTFLFELNTDDTRARLLAGADSFMESVQSRYGVYAFDNVCDDSNNTEQDVDNNRLVFHQLVEPVKSIELIKYFPTIVRTGAIGS